MIIIDNFYEDPMAIRNQALAQCPFDFISSIPGQRSPGISIQESLELKERFEKILNMPITYWHTFEGKEWWKGQPETMNTCFQLINENEKSWVHHDENDWAGLIYLTPNPNPDAGTGLFTHKETGISQFDPNDPSTEFGKHDDAWNLDKWQCHLEVKNVFNRLILYKGTQYHRSMIPGFGNNYDNGRLTQVFFFDTENKNV